ncbi:TetR/AcrR family transcriptional regulator [Sphingomonas sp.]|jgi:AcrR family transcriptional regulator|uniref:TetR/AcrR family transcriptional regulator n=1 Tax=Sphingomonas sp. TaxID=28214 RepID=UPI0035C81235
MTEGKGASRAYHHGNLLRVLLDTAIALIAEKGVEALSMRDLAKRAGVSPGAPFRHFRSKTALVTAVAEEAMARLTAAVRAEIAASPDDPIETLRAIGRGYLDWAIGNPTHFAVVSSRSLIDFTSSVPLVEENEAIRLLMLDVLGRAQERGMVRAGLILDDLMFGARAQVYGLARMWVDGHFDEWKVDGDPRERMFAALDLYIGGIVSRA